jgi:hypothetical protein
MPANALAYSYFIPLHDCHVFQKHAIASQMAQNTDNTTTQYVTNHCALVKRTIPSWPGGYKPTSFLELRLLQCITWPDEDFPESWWFNIHGKGTDSLVLLDICLLWIYVMFQTSILTEHACTLQISKVNRRLLDIIVYAPKRNQWCTMLAENHICSNFHGLGQLNNVHLH